MYINRHKCRTLSVFSYLLPYYESKFNSQFPSGTEGTVIGGQLKVVIK